jgi:hypothetical protein
MSKCKQNLTTYWCYKCSVGATVTNVLYETVLKKLFCFNAPSTNSEHFEML